MRLGYKRWWLPLMTPFLVFTCKFWWSQQPCGELSHGKAQESHITKALVKTQWGTEALFQEFLRPWTHEALNYSNKHMNKLRSEWSLRWNSAGTLPAALWETIDGGFSLVAWKFLTHRNRMKANVCCTNPLNSGVFYYTAIDS